jgi:hypothetical protein
MLDTEALDWVKTVIRGRGSDIIEFMLTSDLHLAMLGVAIADKASMDALNADYLLGVENLREAGVHLEQQSRSGEPFNLDALDRSRLGAGALNELVGIVRAAAEDLHEDEDAGESRIFVEARRRVNNGDLENTREGIWIDAIAKALVRVYQPYPTDPSVHPP